MFERKSERSAQPDGNAVAMEMRYTPFSEEVRANPYPFYATLRQHAPVYFVEAMGALAVARHEDVRFVLSHPELFSSDAMRTMFISSKLGADGPVHGHWCNQFSHAIPPRAQFTKGERKERYRMGKVSGDKARYNRDRRKKIARRVEMRALRATLTATGTTKPQPKASTATKSERA